MHRLSEILSSKAINRLQLDELGDDPAQIGPRSAGQSGGSQGFSPIAEANEESVEELADTDQAFESAAVEGSEDAADHPARPPHTHEGYGRPTTCPQERNRPRG
ncbi:MAG: hypothetical protein QOF94_1752 [Acidobacteriaceae bacterium]|jgi:hypothetical protein